MVAERVQVATAPTALGRERERERQAAEEGNAEVLAGHFGVWVGSARIFWKRV